MNCGPVQCTFPFPIAEIAQGAYHRLTMSCTTYQVPENQASALGGELGTKNETQIVPTDS
jgi:hypothetical protein